MLALLIAAVLGARLIRRPIRRLLAVADRWRNGDLATRTNLGGGGSEFARLGTALDAMAATREASERDLRAVERELREAQQAGRVGTWHWDAATEALTGSGEVLRLYGLDPATSPMPVSKEQRERFYPAESWTRLQEAVRRSAETGVGYELDIEAFCGTEPIWITTRCEVVRDAGGHVIGLRGTVQDITSRKRAEEALRQVNETLERRVTEEVAAREAAQVRTAQAERLAALGQLAGGIAHDFNNVLQAVVGATSLIENRTDVDPGLRRFARMAL